MISSEAVQAALVTALKADAPLVALFGVEIRESQWQGTQFVYPCLRVGVVTGLPYTKDHCRFTHSNTRFTISSQSEEASSQDADIGAGLVVSALLGQTIEGAGTPTTNPFYSSLIELAAPGQESAIINSQNAWTARVHFEVHIHERTP